MRNWPVMAGLAVAVAASAGPIVNGDFETDSLTPWVGFAAWAGSYTHQNPEVVPSSTGNGIEGPSGGPNDAYAVLDSTSTLGNPTGLTTWSGIYQSITFHSITGPVQFTLFDQGDGPPPNVDTDTSGLLVDNVDAYTSLGQDYISFDWYALTHHDTGRNDYFTMSYASNTLFAFGYGDPLMPTTETGGGGGNQFGPYSYGTGWQHTTVAVPEPGTWMLLALGVVPFIRRRRRPM